MNRKSQPATCRFPEQTRPRLLTEYRAPAAAACSHVATGLTRRAPLPPDQGSIPLLAPRSAQPGRPRREWSGQSAQTRGQDCQDHGRHEPDPPSDGETQANTVGVWASVAPLAKASGCPPIRVNPKHQQGAWRPAVLEPPMLGAVDLHQFAGTLASWAWLMNPFCRCLRSRHSPSAIIHFRNVSLENEKPCSAASFSAAKVGPKSA